PTRLPFTPPRYKVHDLRAGGFTHVASAGQVGDLAKLSCTYVERVPGASVLPGLRLSFPRYGQFSGIGRAEPLDAAQGWDGFRSQLQPEPKVYNFTGSARWRLELRWRKFMRLGLYCGQATSLEGARLAWRWVVGSEATMPDGGGRRAQEPELARTQSRPRGTVGA
ncbi:hypothetical protein L0F63_005972, partial [Massospora cicadina]